MLKQYAALAAASAIFLLVSPAALAAELTIEPVFSHIDPDTAGDYVPGDDGPALIIAGFYDPTGTVPRLDTHSPLGNIIYPQTIPSDPLLTPDGNPATPLILFRNNTNYTLTSFTLEIIGAVDPADDQDSTFICESTACPAVDWASAPGDIVVDDPILGQIPYRDIVFGDVGDDGYLGDLFPSTQLSADRHSITFFGGSGVPVGGVFTDYAFMSLGRAALDGLTIPGRLAFRASFQGVPEPATAGLMLAGLAGIGLLAGRRRRLSC